MVKIALFVRLHAREGREQELADLLKEVQPFALQETVTKNWYALQFDERTFGIFDSFENEEGMLEHRKGVIEATLKKRAPELLEQPPVVETITVIASKEHKH